MYVELEGCKLGTYWKKHKEFSGNSKCKTPPHQLCQEQCPLPAVPLKNTIPQYHKYYTMCDIVISNMYVSYDWVWTETGICT